MDPSFETILRFQQKIVSKGKWAFSGNSLTCNCEGKGFRGDGEEEGVGVGVRNPGVLEERWSL